MSNIRYKEAGPSMMLQNKCRVPPTPTVSKPPRKTFCDIMDGHHSLNLYLVRARHKELNTNKLILPSTFLSFSFLSMYVQSKLVIRNVLIRNKLALRNFLWITNPFIP